MSVSRISSSEPYRVETDFFFKEFRPAVELTQPQQKGTGDSSPGVKAVVL
jgi:hypothetical protein